MGLLQITQLRVIDRIVLCPPTMWYRRESDPDISRWPPWSSRLCSERMRSLTRGCLEGSMIGVPWLSAKRRLVCRILERKYFFLPGFFLDYFHSIPERREVHVIWTLIWYCYLWRISMSTLIECLCFSTTTNDRNSPTISHGQPLNLTKHWTWLNLSQSVCASISHNHLTQSAGLSALKTCPHRSGGMSSMICATPWICVDSLVANWVQYVHAKVLSIGKTARTSRWRLVSLEIPSAGLDV